MRIKCSFKFYFVVFDFFNFYQLFINYIEYCYSGTDKVHCFNSFISFLENYFLHIWFRGFFSSETVEPVRKRIYDPIKNL